MRGPEFDLLCNIDRAIAALIYAMHSGMDQGEVISQARDVQSQVRTMLNETYGITAFTPSGPIIHTEDDPCSEALT